MLELKIKPSNDLDAEGKKILLSDDTGLYDDILNPGGYGTPNVSREQIAIFPIGYLNTSGGTKIPVMFDSYNPLLTNSWIALADRDGWYSFNLVYATAVSTLIIELYEPGDIIYSINDSKLFKVIGDPTVEIGLSFKEAKIEDLVKMNNSKTSDQLFLANLSFLKIALNEKKVEVLIDSENLSNSKRLKLLSDAYNDVRSILQAAIYQFCIGNKYQAARYIAYLSTNNYDKL